MKHHLTAAVTAALIASLIFLFMPKAAQTTVSVPAKQESAYERVSRSGVLRCGYITWPRLHDVDLKTGSMSGMWHDYVMTLAEQLNLKIEWAEEVGPADFISTLQSGRIDAMCAPIGRLIPRMRGAAFTTPITYVAMGAYVRADDNRFDKGLSALNTAGVKITSMEGEFNSVIARSRFPLAQLDEFPSMLGPSQGYMNVADGKADVVFADIITISDYLANNPGKLKPLPESLGVFGGAIAVAGDEMALLRMLDDASRTLVESGVIASLVIKYELTESLNIPAYSYHQADK
jgi:ABC-type amino acid transport substrate-binding protein